MGQVSLRDLRSAAKRFVASSLFSPAIFTRYWWAVGLLIIFLVLAGLWAAKHTDLTEWSPLGWKRYPSGAPSDASDGEPEQR